MDQALKDSIVKKPGAWGVFAPVKGKIYFGIFLGALSSAFVIVTMVSFAWVIDILLHDRADIWLWVGLAFTFTILGLATKLAAFTISHLGAFKLEEVLRTGLSDHLAKVPLGFLVQKGSGSISKVIQDDVKTLHAFVADSTPFYGRSIAMPLITLILLIVIDWRMALAALGVLFISMIPMSYAMRDHKELSRRYTQEKENINNTVIEFVQAMPVIRTFDDGSSSFGRYQEALKGYRGLFIEWLEKAGVSTKFAMILLSPLATLLALFVIGALFYANGAIAFSTWLAILLIGAGLVESIMPLMWLNEFIRNANASAKRIQALLQEPILPITENPQEPKDASIEFENVTFSYGDRGQNALEDVSFIVPSGSVSALVGPSGAGKSTVAKLIPRFWDIDKGTIKIGGVDVRDMSSETLMNNVSFVFQDTFLFHDTLANNIKLGLDNTTQADIEEAAKAAQAHEFILQLPDGYETVAGDRGARLSGGQRQRITIARAILQKRPIVVLDEATAFADPENEAALIKALSNLMKDRTVIVIAHRLATIKDADEIVVFDHGKISEKGKHQQLVENKGVYAKLWSNYEQAQGWSLSNHIEEQSQQKAGV